jgi:transposase
VRGGDHRRDGLFSYVRPQASDPSNRPLRLIRKVCDEALNALNQQFGVLYSDNGRPSIPREQLQCAFLPQAFYSIRSERQLKEQLCSLLFRWFVSLPDDPVWVPTVFRKNRHRLKEHRGGVHGRGAESAAGQGGAVGRTPLGRRHADPGMASMKSFRRKDGSDEPPAADRNGGRTSTRPGRA